MGGPGRRAPPRQARWPARAGQAACWRSDGPGLTALARCRGDPPARTPARHHQAADHQQHAQHRPADRQGQAEHVELGDVLLGVRRELAHGGVVGEGDIDQGEDLLARIGLQHLVDVLRPLDDLPGAGLDPERPDVAVDDVGVRRRLPRHAGKLAADLHRADLDAAEALLELVHGQAVELLLAQEPGREGLLGGEVPERVVLLLDVERELEDQALVGRVLTAAVLGLRADPVERRPLLVGVDHATVGQVDGRHEAVPHGRARRPGLDVAPDHPDVLELDVGSHLEVGAVEVAARADGDRLVVLVERRLLQPGVGVEAHQQRKEQQEQPDEHERDTNSTAHQNPPAWSFPPSDQRGPNTTQTLFARTHRLTVRGVTRRIRVTSGGRREPHSRPRIWTALMQSHALDAPAARAGSLLRAGILVAPLMALGNGLNYVYNIVMARLLGPAGYGALGALLALALIAAVQGMLQGRERFALLAVVLVAAAAGKLAAGVALVALGTGVDGAIAAVAVGSLAAVLLALVWVRPGGRSGRTARDWARLLPRGLGREVAAATGGILGLFVLANVDVLLARHHLGAAASGLYAAGAVVAKIAYWAPQFVVLIVFPRMVTSSERGPLLARSTSSAPNAAMQPA